MNDAPTHSTTPPTGTDNGSVVPLDAEQQSKDGYFQSLGRLTDAMRAAHGDDFTIGTLLLAARYLAQGKVAPGAAPSSAVN